MRVDLPAPFSPQMAWISPSATARLMSSLATTPGNVLVIPYELDGQRHAASPTNDDRAGR